MERYFLLLQVVYSEGKLFFILQAFGNAIDIITW